MIVLDTHAWLWWATEPARLSRAAREAIDGAERFGVATISCWEIAMLVEARRVELDRPVETWIEQALGDARAQPVSLSGVIAVQAALLERDGFPADPADRIIYATARQSGARLVTKDRAMHTFDPRNTVW